MANELKNSGEDVYCPRKTETGILRVFKILNLSLIFLIIMRSEFKESEIYNTALVILLYFHGLLFILISRKFHGCNNIGYYNFLPFANILIHSIAYIVDCFEKKQENRSFEIYAFVAMCTAGCIVSLLYCISENILSNVLLFSILFGVFLCCDICLRFLDAKAKIVSGYISLLVVVFWGIPSILFMSPFAFFVSLFYLEIVSIILKEECLCHAIAILANADRQM